MGDDEDQKKAKTGRCIVRAIVLNEVDPNEISIEAIHASCIRLITNFMQRPSADLANGVIKMLNALANHNESFKPDSGHNVYQQAALVWQGMIDTSKPNAKGQHSNERIVH